MKVAKLYSVNDIRIEDMPVPEVGSREALIEVKASGICSGDVMSWYIEKKAPLVLGHEAAGTIVKVGEEVDAFTAGDRVFVHHHAPCMICSSCKRGNFVHCREWRESNIIPGGIAEYLLIPEGILRNDTLKLPEGVTYEDATLIEPTACVVKSLRRSGFQRGDTVLILGLGIMGMIHLLLVKEMGAQTVIGADMVTFRLEKAKELGVDAVVDVSNKSIKKEILSITGKERAHIVIVGPNSIEAMHMGLQCVSPGGVVVLFTPAKPGDILSVDPNYLYFNEITLVPSYSCGPDDTLQALEMVKRGVVKAEKLVTHRYRIDKTKEAYQTVAAAASSLKTLVVFS